MQGVVGLLIAVLLQIYGRISQYENRLRFDRDISVSMVSPFLRNTVYMGD